MDIQSLKQTAQTLHRLRIWWYLNVLSNYSFSKIEFGIHTPTLFVSSDFRTQLTQNVPNFIAPLFNSSHRERERERERSRAARDLKADSIKNAISIESEFQKAAKIEQIDFGFSLPQKPQNCQNLIEIEAGANLGYYPSPRFYEGAGYIGVSSGARIFIGSKTWINNAFSISADMYDILIGRNCRIGVGFRALNSDGHGLEIAYRDDSTHTAKGDIVIGDDCFLGDNVCALKGVRLGRGCVVGAGSVITKSFAQNSIIAGNPAKLIKIIKQD